MEDNDILLEQLEQELELELEGSSPKAAGEVKGRKKRDLRGGPGAEEGGSSASGGTGRKRIHRASGPTDDKRPSAPGSFQDEVRSAMCNIRTDLDMIKASMEPDEAAEVRSAQGEEMRRLRIERERIRNWQIYGNIYKDHVEGLPMPSWSVFLAVFGLMFLGTSTVLMMYLYAVDIEFRFILPMIIVSIAMFSIGLNSWVGHERYMVERYKLLLDRDPDGARGAFSGGDDPLREWLEL